jgi:hypothetical protein
MNGSLNHVLLDGRSTFVLTAAAGEMASLSAYEATLTAGLNELYPPLRLRALSCNSTFIREPNREVLFNLFTLLILFDSEEGIFALVILDEGKTILVVKALFGHH